MVKTLATENVLFRGVFRDFKTTYLDPDTSTQKRQTDEERISCVLPHNYQVIVRYEKLLSSDN